jgi:hypothetical protein
MTTSRPYLARLSIAAAWFVAACSHSSSGGEREPAFTREELMDPKTCRACHRDHYEEWSQSMHAYAATDPVFLAMNRRGQEETGGALGDFCVRCHAPMAVREGRTENGLNLDSLDDSLKGVTCYFCHNAKSVEGTHNNPVLLDDENPLTLRGGIEDPVSSSGHYSEGSPLLAGAALESASLCGSCHDIVLPSPPAPEPTGGAPVELERTFAEWQKTLFAPGNLGSNPNGFTTCIGCHMPPPARGSQGEVAPRAGRKRRLHDHVMAGVDVTLDMPAAGQAPNLNEQRVQGFLDTTLRARMCVEYSLDTEDRDRIRLLVDLDNVGAGHAFPSGASQDRQAWVDVRVLLDETEVYSSGAAAEGEDPGALPDPSFWQFRDRASKSDGSPAHMFWDVAAVSDGTIPGPVTRVASQPGYDKTHAVRSFPRGVGSWIDAPYDPERLRVELRVRVQPIAYDVLDDLVASGHLGKPVRDAMRARTLLLNKSFARPELVAKTPELARFNELSFEWSPLTLNSAFFNKSTRPNGVTELSCVEMIRAQ